jgi:hypothetical protein
MVAGRESTTQFQDTKKQSHVSSLSVCVLVSIYLSEGSLMLITSKLCGFFLHLALLPTYLLSSH